MGEMLRASPETVRLHLLQISSVLKTSHWVLHIVTDDLSLIRVEMCQTMLAGLRVQEYNPWHDIVTGEESWFYFEYVRDRLWISCLDNTPDYPKRTIATENYMLTEFWNPDGFQAVTILPAAAWFNVAWFIDGNLVPLRHHFFRGKAI
jgi:hypothetical protein